ncbi:MAG: hypothetical protein II857_00650 [Selenomonadaceae bacterium]|nr:hypothetical protein [Selenomonadaceae bacterium]
MGIWEVKVSSLDIDVKVSAKSSSKSVASEYSKILAEKISNIKTDVQAMRETQEQLDEIRDMHEELTGEIKIDEDSGNANRNGGDTSTKIVEVETIKRFMPDGSIMITTYEGGKITGQVRHKPHMMVVPDYTAPPKADGSPATELKPYQNLDLEMLLMM